MIPNNIICSERRWLSVIICGKINPNNMIVFGLENAIKAPLAYKDEFLETSNPVEVSPVTVFFIPLSIG